MSLQKAAAPAGGAAAGAAAAGTPPGTSEGKLAVRLRAAQEQIARQGEALQAARELLCVLQAEHNAAVDDAAAARAERAELVQQLTAIQVGPGGWGPPPKRPNHVQRGLSSAAHPPVLNLSTIHPHLSMQSRYAGLEDFMWNLDSTQLEPATLEAASEAAGAAAAASAAATPPASRLVAGSGPLFPFGLLPAPNPLGAVPPSCSEEDEPLAASQRDMGLLLAELQRTQEERDALMWRLEETEHYVRALQAQQEKRAATAPAGPAEAGCLKGGRKQGAAPSPASAIARVERALAELSGLIADGPAPGSPALLQAACSGLQSQVVVLCDQAAAAASAADQLQQLLAAEREEAGRLQQRLAAAVQRQRGSHQRQLALQQHVGELEVRGVVSCHCRGCRAGLCGAALCGADPSAPPAPLPPHRTWHTQRSPRPRGRWACCRRSRLRRRAG